MNKKIKNILGGIFNIIYPVLKPSWIQLFLRRVGFRFPYYRFAEKLDYRGKVDFVVNGKKLFLQSDNQSIEMHIFWSGIYGVWEPTQLKLWSSLVKQADVILDIGANTGIYSLIASTNNKANIFAFEPVPDVIKMLETNIELNSPNRIKIVDKLVGDKVGKSTIYIPRSGWVDVASVDKDFAGKFANNEKLLELKKEMVTVDDFLTRNNVNFNQRILCKIDVEGAEEMVLLGMAEALVKRKIVFTIELLNKEYFTKVLKIIPSDYKIYAIDEVNRRVYLTDIFVKGATNYLCSKDDLADIVTSI